MRASSSYSLKPVIDASIPLNWISCWFIVFFSTLCGIAITIAVLVQTHQAKATSTSTISPCKLSTTLHDTVVTPVVWTTKISTSPNVAGASAWLTSPDDPSLRIEGLCHQLGVGTFEIQFDTSKVPSTALQLVLEVTWVFSTSCRGQRVLYCVERSPDWTTNEYHENSDPPKYPTIPTGS